MMACFLVEPPRPPGPGMELALPWPPNTETTPTSYAHRVSRDTQYEWTSQILSVLFSISATLKYLWHFST